MKKMMIMVFLFSAFYHCFTYCDAEVKHLFEEPEISLNMDIEKEPEEIKLHPVWDAPTYLQVGASYMYYSHIKPALKKVLTAILMQENSNARDQRQ